MLDFPRETTPTDIYLEELKKARDSGLAVSEDVYRYAEAGGHIDQLDDKQIQTLNYWYGHDLRRAIPEREEPSPPFLSDEYLYRNVRQYVAGMVRQYGPYGQPYYGVSLVPWRAEMLKWAKDVGMESDQYFGPISWSA